MAWLAADELLAQGRREELVRLLLEMARLRPRAGHARTALLALSIAKRLELLVDKLKVDRRQLLCRSAVAVLTDVEHFEPEQRLIAKLLGSGPGLDARRRRRRRISRPYCRISSG